LTTMLWAAVGQLEQEQKAHRKKEKQRIRQERSKREAAAHRAQAVVASRPEPEQVAQQVPEMDHQSVPISQATQPPTSPSAGASLGKPSSAVRAPPDEFCCPITSECMHDPVIVTATGMTYERQAIAEWLSEHDTDPSTGVELHGNKQLTPNMMARKLISAWSHDRLAV
jgi:hypothetical protein